MNFFNTTEFYCLAMVTAVALIGLLMHQAPQKPAETYITKLLLSADPGDSDDAVSLSVLADGAILLTRTGIVGNDELGVNLVAEVCGDKIKIIEKRAQPLIIGEDSGNTHYRGIAELKFVGNGHYSVRYESEVTGTWCTFSVLKVEGFATQAVLRY